MNLSAMRAGNGQIVLRHFFQESRESLATVGTDDLGTTFWSLDFWSLVVRHAYQMLAPASWMRSKPVE